MQRKNQLPEGENSKSMFSLRQSQSSSSTSSRKSPPRFDRRGGSPKRVTMEETSRVSTPRASRKSVSRKTSALEDVTDEDEKNKTRTRNIRKEESNESYDGYDDQDESDEESPKEKKSRKSPRKTKRKVNKWAEMIGYITNSVAAEVGYSVRAEQFMPIIRKNYPGNPPPKKKVSREMYKERAKAKLQILKDADPTLVDRANKSIKEILQEIKKQEAEENKRS